MGQSVHIGGRSAQEPGALRRNHDQQTDHEDPGRRSGGHDHRRADRRRVDGVRRYSRYRLLAIDRSACGDGDRVVGAVALFHPGIRNEDSVKPPGRGRSLSELMEWYDANGWEWEVGDCTEVGDGAVDCDVVVRTDWSDALGIAPSATQYRVAVSDEGVRGLRGLGDDCCPGIDEFTRWVTDMYPDDAAVMWDGPEMNPQIMRLFEINTATSPRMSEPRSP